VKASFVLTEDKGVIYISARAIDEVNVQIIMERMGGGGHLNMAGTQFTGKTMDEVKTLLKSVLDEMIVEGEIE
jgi:c-di-AMP phosphodiesterase-like protein